MKQNGPPRQIDRRGQLGVLLSGAAALFVACADPPCAKGEAGCEAPAGSGATDSGGAPGEGDSLPFTVETFACTAPTTLGWSLVSTPSPVEPPREDEVFTQGAGGVALLDNGDGALLFWADLRYEAHALAIGEALADAAALPTLVGVRSMSIADLEGDGEDELLAYFGGSVQVVTDTSGAAPQSRSAIPLRPGPQDLSPGYLDDDDTIDLFATYSLPDEEPAAQIWLAPGLDLTGEKTEVADDAGGWGKTFDTTVLDLDDDAQPDAYICNDKGHEVAPNALYHNTGGDFVEGTHPAGLDLITHCMGSDWGDLDGDGRLDLVIGDVNRIWLLQNDAELGMIDVTHSRWSGTVAADQMYWGMSVSDLDNDGRTDLLMPTSWFLDGTEQPWPVRLAMQQADGHFEEQGAAFGLPEEADARTVIAYDWNADGVLDLVFGDGQRSPWIYESNGCTDQRWLTLRGPEGTRVEVEAGGRRFVALITSESSFASARPRSAHIGLGELDTIDRVTWHLPWAAPVTVEGPFPTRSVLRWTGL